MRNISWQFHLLSEFLAEICRKEIKQKILFVFCFDVGLGARVLIDTKTHICFYFVCNKRAYIKTFLKLWKRNNILIFFIFFYVTQLIVVKNYMKCYYFDWAVFKFFCLLNLLKESNLFFFMINHVNKKIF